MVILVSRHCDISAWFTAYTYLHAVDAIYRQFFNVEYWQCAWILRCSGLCAAFYLPVDNLVAVNRTRLATNCEKEGFIVNHAAIFSMIRSTSILIVGCLIPDLLAVSSQRLSTISSSVNASSRVSPWAIQPLRAGISATYPPSIAGYVTNGYLRFAMFFDDL